MEKEMEDVTGALGTSHTGMSRVDRKEENVVEEHQEVERGTPRGGEHHGGTPRDGDKNTKRCRTS